MTIDVELVSGPADVGLTNVGPTDKLVGLSGPTELTGLTGPTVVPFMGGIEENVAWHSLVAKSRGQFLWYSDQMHFSIFLLLILYVIYNQ